MPTEEMVNAMLAKREASFGFTTSYVWDDSMLDYRDSLKEALSLYKRLSAATPTREIMLRGERKEVWQRLVHALEDWMSLCLYGDFMENLRNNRGLSAEEFINKYLKEEA